MSNLVAALIARLGGRRLAPDERSRSEQVLLDVLRPVEFVLLDLPLPDDDRAKRVADALIDAPADSRTLTDWGQAVGASDRTLMRMFRSGTGLSFYEWRTRARVAAAPPQLAAVRPVAVVPVETVNSY